jgi:CXCXC repeat
MRIFLAFTALAGLLASGIGCVASPESGESDAPAQAGEALKTDAVRHVGPTTNPGGCVEAVVCVDGEHWDSKSCSCVGPVCDPLVCPDGEHWDPESCSCVGPICDPLLCRAGQSWDPETCSCECVEMVICIDGKHWDPRTCRCEKPIASTPASHD